MPAPCKPDHNGECLVCDAWPSDCAWNKLMKRDFTYQSEKELVELFYPYMSDEEKIKISLTMGKIFAPFSVAQVEKLKQWQTGMLPLAEGEDNAVMLAIGGQPVHPFTCCTPDFCKLKNKTGIISWLRRLIKGKAAFDNSLIPSTEGWICPCGKYKQNRAHDYMAGDFIDEKKDDAKKSN